MTEATIDRRCQEVILALLGERGPKRSICPSEAARRVAQETGTDWRTLMPAIRAAADRLQSAGALEITQGERALAAATNARGPIRLRLRAQARSSGMSS